MARTIRKYWGPMNGRQTLNFNWPPINAGSTVIVTASEYVRAADLPGGGFADQDHKRFVGSANVTVHNVSPHGSPWDPNNGVTFVVNVDWPHPILIVTDITVLDRPEIVQN